MKKALAAASTALSYLLINVPAYAVQTLEVDRPKEARVTDLGALLSAAISVVIIVAGILIFVYLVWGGFQYMTSGGDKQKTEEARNRITAALAGLAIIAAAWALTVIISNFFGAGGGIENAFTIPSNHLLP